MLVLHNIGPRFTSNYNTREEVIASKGPISFDGVYRSLFRNLDALKGRDITLFVMGNYTGKDNSFDIDQPKELFCSWDDIVYLCSHFNAKLGWHTWSHKNLCDLMDEEVIKEITPPFPMESFAYPFGNVDSRVAGIVRAVGFKEAWSVTQGDGTQFQKNRSYLNW
jgi:hypothetical protein